MSTEKIGAVVKRTGRGGRDYTWGPTGEKFPSVTTLLGGLAKPALPYWAAAEVAEEAYERAALLDQYRADDDKAGAIRWLKDAPWRRSKSASETGTAVHARIEALTTGAQVGPAGPEEVPFIRSWDAFRRDNEPEFHMAEAPVFNREEKYAGTLDAVATFHKGEHAGGPYVIDYKTSSKSLAFLAANRKPGPPYPEIALQLAAYGHATFVGVADGSEQPMPETVGGIAIILFSDGYRLVPVETGEDVFMAFRYAREAYRWSAVTSKTVFGDAITVEVNA